MCMKATSEGCELRDELKQTKAAVASLDTRLTKVEGDVALMRSETQEGIRALTASVANLAHDFGSRMNNIDKRLVEEKERWGTTMRSIVIWTARLVLTGCAVAMGVATYKQIFAGGS